MFFRIDVLKYFAMFTIKHLFWSFFLIKLEGYSASVLKKRRQHSCSTVNIAKRLRADFFTEHLCWLLLSFFSLAHSIAHCLVYMFSLRLK